MPQADEEQGYPRAIESLLEQAVPSTRIPEARIQVALQAARVHERSRRRLLGATTATGLILLAAATVWHWSGHESDDLDFATALSIARGDGSYDKGAVQAAAGRVYRDAHSLLGLLHKRGALPPAMRQAATSAFAGQGGTTLRDSGGPEAVLTKLQNGQQLDPDDEAIAVAAICEAIRAFREMRERTPELTPTANNLLRFLQSDLQGPEQAPQDR